MVMILAIVATGILWMSFSRHVLLSRANESESNQQLAAGAQSQVMACLDGTDYGKPDCSLPASAVACFPASVESRTVSVTSSGSPPNCQVAVTVNE